MVFVELFCKTQHAFFAACQSNVGTVCVMLTGRPKWSEYRASITQRRLDDHIASDYGWVDNTVIYHPPSCMGKLWRWCCCIVGVLPPAGSLSFR